VSAERADGRVPPYNLEAEESLLGAMLLSRDAIVAASEMGVSADDFYKPAHAHVFDAITSLYSAGEPADPVTVGEELRRANLLAEVGGPGLLVSLQVRTPATSSAARYARIVSEHALLRRLIAEGGEIVELGYSVPEDPAGAVERARERLAGLAARGTSAGAPDPDLDAFLAEPDPEHDWLVPGLLERHDRTMLTGPEGGGKSTLLRQIAVQLASGVHPFTLDEITPLRVLLVDLENGRNHVRRELRKLRAGAGRRYAGGLVPLVRSEGLDLLQDDDVRWLTEAVVANRPDLLVIGPLYKMASGKPTDEEPARAVAAALDRLRIQYGFALMAEAHTPHATNGGSRPTRPFGASLWLRWPEFGLHLSETGQLTHWRGARDERSWPAALRRGGEWLWTVESDQRAVTFARLIEETRSAGKRLTVRELGERTGAGKSSIQRAIDANRTQWDELCQEVAS
jgi:hypothetical protein